MALGLVDHVVGDVALAQQGDRLGERQRGALPVGEEVDLPPGREDVEAPLVLADAAGLPGVEVEAEGAAVDLGGPQLDEVAQRGRQGDSSATARPKAAMAR